MQVPAKRRTTTGCLTCRVRKKKCDEEKPTCTGCKRNFLICNWVEGEKADKVALSRAAGTITTAIVGLVAKKGGFRPVLPATGELRGPYTCSSLYPLNLMPGPRLQTDGFLFDHYLQVTSAQLAGRIHPLNPFVSHLIPVAVTEAAVFQCILAISGAQLCAKSDEYEHSARSHYAVSLRSVKHNLLQWQNADTKSLMGLLTATLLLGFFEVKLDLMLNRAID